MLKEKVILINYTGRYGGGALDAYEVTKALLLYTPNIVAIVSEYAENIEAWRLLPLKKIVVIPTYRNNMEFIIDSFTFGYELKDKIRHELSDYEVSWIYCPMVAMWSQKINRLFPNAKTYIALHDPIPHSKYKMAFFSKFLELFGFGISKEIYMNADSIIVHSRCFVDYVEKKYHKNNSVYYLPLGRHNFYKNIACKESIIEYDSNKWNFLFFGTINHYKGIGILLDAFTRIEARYKNVTLTIAGNGNFDEFKEKCNGLGNLTVINRWIRDSEVDSLFSGENIIVVVPYLDATQSGVILVAMDYHVPIIASATGGIVEQIEDGMTGILVEPGNVGALEIAMEKLMNDDNMRKNLEKNMKKSLEEISWDKSAQGLLNLMSFQM